MKSSRKSSLANSAAETDLLVAQYQQNERGIPTAPRIVTTEGVWRA